MDSLHFCIAVVPLAAYMLMVAWINLRRYPFLTTGARDLAALAIGISGLMIAGPLELFLPESLAAAVGGWVWLPLLTLYALVVTLILLLARPRLVVYNIGVDRLRPILKQISHELDSNARWAGDSVWLPELGISLAIDAQPGISNVTLASVSNDQNLDGWALLRKTLSASLKESQQPPNVQGVSFMVLAIFLTLVVVYSLFTGRQEIAQSFRQMLRM